MTCPSRGCVIFSLPWCAIRRGQVEVVKALHQGQPHQLQLQGSSIFESIAEQMQGVKFSDHAPRNMPKSAHGQAALQRLMDADQSWFSGGPVFGIT